MVVFNKEGVQFLIRTILRLKTYPGHEGVSKKSLVKMHNLKVKLRIVFIIILELQTYRKTEKISFNRGKISSSAGVQSLSIF